MGMKITRRRRRSTVKSDFSGRKPFNFYDRFDIRTILFWIAMAAVSVFLMLFFTDPFFSGIRESLAFKIALRTVFTGGVLFFVWRIDDQSSLLFKVLTSIIAILPWGELIFPTDRPVMAAHIILFFIFAVHSLNYAFENEVQFTSLLASFYLGLRLYIPGTNRFTFPDKDFWILAFVFGIIGATAAVIIVLRNNGSSHRHPILNTLCIAFLTFVLTIAITRAIAIDVNYAFDFSEQQTYTVTISEIETERVSRGVYDSFFNIYPEGELVELEVSEAAANLHKAGDEISVIKGEGFFGVPYFMLDE